MTFGANVNGHGGDHDKIEEAFRKLGESLHDAGVISLSGSAWGSEGQMPSFNIQYQDYIPPQQDESGTEAPEKG